MLLKDRILTSIFSWIYSIVIRLLGSTWKVTMIRDEETLELITQYKSVVYAFWHSRILPLSFTHRNRGVGVLISIHRDGELIAKAVEKMGFIALRGSSTKGGVKALKSMIEFASSGHPIAITPDGPKGPVHKVKPGMLLIAKELKIPIILVGVNANKKWVMKSWDSFIIPKLFAKVAIVFSEPIFLENENNQEKCKMIEDTLFMLDNKALELIKGRDLN